MANVVFRVGPAATNGKGAELTVDGIDITDHVLAGGVTIAPSGDFGDIWAVTLTLAVESLEADLPDAVIHALSGSEMTA